MKHLILALLGTVLSAANLASADDPVALRVENLTVPPSTGPLAFVDVENLQNKPYRGSITMKAPQGWQIAPPKREVSLGPGEMRRVPFTIEKGRNVKANSYSIEVSATGAGVTVVRKQAVACASAPYYKPEIDGDPGEWQDAIPVAFAADGKQTVVRTYWNRRQFSILVAVEEDELIGYQPKPDAAGFDAVQVSISPQDTRTGTSGDDEAVRYEFLFVAAGNGAADNGTEGRCFQLAAPGMKLAEAAKERSLGPLECEDAEVAIGRRDGVTYYECGISFRRMRDDIRPSEGREFFLSVLVHDPDGTGLRDLGRAAGLWPWRRNPLAWSRWVGAKRGEKPPFDNKLHWGLCTSKY